MLPQNFLTTDTVATDVPIQSKKRLLEYVAEQFVGQNQELDVSTVFEKLIERERLGSTGLGKGIALPHARIDGLTHAQAVFLKPENGIDYDAIDNSPVDLVVALLVPAETNEAHLQILAGLAGFFNNDDNCTLLRETADHQKLVDLLINGIENTQNS
jgi:PTS system nitrogen regulatory IIA component